MNAAVLSSASAQGTAAMTGVCERSPQVAEAISEQTRKSCRDVTTDDLAAVVDLELSGRGIEELRAGDFAGLRSLQTLDLRSNALTSLPAGLLSGLTELRILTMHHNRLTAIPDDLVAGQDKLQMLKFADNPIAALPRGLLWGKTGLRHFGIAGMALTSIDEDLFRDTPLLIEMSFSGNRIERVPARIFSTLNNLCWLGIGANPYKTLPDRLFDGMTALADLFADSTGLEELPEGLFFQASSKLPALKYADFRGADRLSAAAEARLRADLGTIVRLGPNGGFFDPGHCALPPPSCEGVADGLYCGRDRVGIGSDPAILYRCVNGEIAIAQTCRKACAPMAKPFDDACR